MECRKNIAEMVRSTSVDYDREFLTMREMVNHAIRSQFDYTDWLSMMEDFQPGIDDDFTMVSVRDLWRSSFGKFPTDFRGTCRKIEDYDGRYGFDFEKPGRGPTSKNDLLNYCEYVMTLTLQLKNYWMTRMGVIPDRIREHVDLVLDKLGHVGHMNGYYFVTLPKDERVDEVAEALPATLGERIRLYRHRSMFGRTDEKRMTLADLARHLESSRSELKKSCPSYESCFFGGVNNLNIRHNNTAPGPKFNDKISTLDVVDLEQAYDALFDVGVRLVDFLKMKPTIDKVNALFRV